MAERLYVTPRMREVAPHQCKQIDALRKYRRFALKGHIYCKNRCKEVEAAVVLQSIAAIDDLTADLLHAAKQMVEGVATGVELRNAAGTNTDISHSLD